MIDRQQWAELSALLDEGLLLDDARRKAWLTVLATRDAALAARLARMLVDAPATAAMPCAAPQFDQLLGRALSDAPPPATDDGSALVGRRLGAWVLVGKIGEGGMGQVWQAQRADGLYQAQAAIKLLRSDLPATSLAARFARERAVLGRLDHPGIARLLDAGVAQDGQAWLVLEYVAGVSLGEHVRSACTTVAQRVQLLVRIAEAVDHAHARLIVHRDLKPSNVVVTPEGEPKLLDFGIAGLLDDDGAEHGHLTRLTGRRLTLGYAAPEQVSGAPIGVAADVFSLGVMLFELLSGELPFAPRHGTRAALEHALLHDEPRRLSQTTRPPSRLSRPATPETIVDDTAGLAAAAWTAGELVVARPTDFRRVRGDIEAIVAKALRKDPAQRYTSVRALIDDLQRWLRHRPVSARRDDWRHRFGLWLRRNALLTVAGAGITLTLAGGLVASNWEWRRAESAARQSDNVTRYLSDLLGSASPDLHGGNWPTVLQLLETSRRDLNQRFGDDPDTLVRLQEVLSQTYGELNRYDIATPIAEQRVALADSRYGQRDERSIKARLDLSRLYTQQGSFDKAVMLLEPLRQTVTDRFGAQSDENRLLLAGLAYSYARVGRLAEADELFAVVGRITEAIYPPGSVERVMHFNDLQVLRTQQGRYREGLEALRKTEPYWGKLPAKAARSELVLRRNMIAVQIRLADYGDVEAKAQLLLIDIDKLLGAGNDMAAGLRAELARYYTETGQFAKALQQRDEILASARAAAITYPALLLPVRALRLPALALALGAPRSALQQEAHTLLAEIDAALPLLGQRRADAWVALARLGLMLDDAALAADALQRVHGDKGLNLATDKILASRIDQLDGELARLKGDLAASRDLLQRRMRYYDDFTEAATPTAWSSQLDLVYTLVLLRDPDATLALARAARLRPQGMPAGTALDAVQAYLLAVHQQAEAPGREDTAPARQARRALDRAFGRDANAPQPLRAALGGAFL